MKSGRSENEIDHGRFLAGEGPELHWGWGTPAGRVRAIRRADLIVRGAKLAPGYRALEIGCGTGMFSEMFVKTGITLVAVDISADLLRKAEQRNLPKNLVTFLEKRFEDCDIDGPFDAVIGSSVLHHLELNDSLRKIHGLLKPGGRLSFAEPNMLNPQVFAERRFRSLFPYVSPNETAFVRWSLARALAGAGFVNIRIRPFDWLHPGTPKSLIALVSAIGEHVEAIPFLREFSGSLCISAEKP
jgi:SAM-dependent methyltransferase